MADRARESWMNRLKETNNKIICRIRNNNDPSFTQINVATGGSNVDRDMTFSLLGDDWQGLDELGKCIGGTTNLTNMKLYLYLNDGPNEDDDDLYKELSKNDPRMKKTVLFSKGLATNTSIQSIYLHAPGGNIFGLLNPFFKNNPNLSKLVIDECHGYYQWWDDFVSALRDCVSLKSVKVNHMLLTGEESGEIFQTLRIHQPQLEVLEFPGNQLTRRSCEGEEALVNLLHDCTHLNTLNIGCNSINNNALYTLMPQLGKLRHLDLSDNMTITTNGFKEIATLLGDPSCNLEELFLARSGISSDETLCAFATAIAKNTKLITLDLTGNRINAAGWAVFSNVLCDTSSINNTFHSNHTLLHLDKDNREALGVVRRYLVLNHYADKKNTATMKILQYSRHNITMHSFFEWELKCLPIAVNWFDNARPGYFHDHMLRQEVETSKLQAIYEFVRGMPVECADGYFGRNKKGSKKRARS